MSCLILRAVKHQLSTPPPCDGAQQNLLNIEEISPASPPNSDAVSSDEKTQARGFDLLTPTGFLMDSPPAHSRPRSLPLDVLAIAVAGTVLVLLRGINYGVDVDYDGTAYLIRATRMLAGPGWLAHTSGLHPPLFPLLLAFVGVFGMDLVHVTGLVNAVAFGLTIWFSGIWLRTRLHSPLIAIWATVAIFLSIPLTSLASRAVSEPVFILFTVLALIQAEVFLDRNTSASLIRAALFSALACLTRYPGFALISAVALLLLLQRGTAFSEKCRQTTVYSFIAVAPCSLFLLRNWMLSGAFFWHHRHLPDYVPAASELPLAQHLHHALKEIAGWGFPISPDLQGGMLGVADWLPVACLLVGGTSTGFLFLRSRRRVRLNLPVPFWLFALIYFVLILVVALLDSQDLLLKERYLSPLYIPLVFIISVVVDGLLKGRHVPLPVNGPAAETKRTGWLGRLVGTVLIAAMLLWLHFPATQYVRDAVVHLNQGYMYTSVDWRNSAIVRYLREHSVDDPVHTNLDDPLEFLTRLRTTRLRTPKQLREMTITPSVHIVWFPVGRGRQSKKLRSAIEGLSGIQTVFSEDNGTIYRLSLRGKRSLDEIMENTPPIIRSNAYDVYLDGDRLVYIRKVAVVQNDVSRRFFLHIVPADRKNLHRARAWLGHRQYDWTEDCSWWSAGKCAAVVRLPKYAIASIRTGQYLAGPNRTYGDLSYRRAVQVVWDFITTGRFVLEDHIWEGQYRFRPSITPTL